MAVTREEARRAFGNPEVYIEKFLRASAPRRDPGAVPTRHGNALWLGSRDCSLQRRHQKVIEEAPAPGIDEALIAAGRRALRRGLPADRLLRRRHLRISLRERRVLSSSR